MISLRMPGLRRRGALHHGYGDQRLSARLDLGGRLFGDRLAPLQHILDDEIDRVPEVLQGLLLGVAPGMGCGQDRDISAPDGSGSSGHLSFSKITLKV
jgi:hypothetical protein